MRSIILRTAIGTLLVPTALTAQALAAPAPAPVPDALVAPSVEAPDALPAVPRQAPEALTAAPAPAPLPAPQAPHAHAPLTSAPRVALLSMPAWPQDPADGAFREARETLNRGDYRRAAQAFGEIPRRWPRSRYAPDAYYWQAFALSKQQNAGVAELRAARTALTALRRDYPRADVRDAAALRANVVGRLAQLGDADAVQENSRSAATASRPSPAPAPRAAQQPCPDDDDEDDTRVVALNALLQMDAESAVPILKQVLARKDACSVVLRRKAVFLLSQKRSPETADILVDLVRNDPDREVREQAIFWLSQVDGARAVDALEGILRTSNDAGIQEKAVFALSQHRSTRAGELLREFALRNEAPVELRGQAIFWLGQQHAGESARFLRELYGRINNDELKEKVVFSLSQHRAPENAQFLLDIALDNAESAEMRKQALFWAGQSRSVSIERLTQLYDQVSDTEVKEQLIFVYSQRRDQAAVDKLMDIAKNERDAELRKKAIFWLGQVNDPRVARFLLDLING